MTFEVPVDELVRTLRGGPPLRLAVLFGSGARGTMHAGSDLDIGIVPTSAGLSWAAETGLQADLAHACGRDVDVVRLDEATTLLRGQVARDGRPLLESTPGEFTRFRVAALIEYLDFLPAYDAAAECFRQSLLAPRGGAATGSIEGWC